MSQIQYRQMMSSSDALIWNIERDPNLRSTVMSVWVLDEAPTRERMAANLDRMVAAIPRLRQRVVEGKPRPTWGRVEIDLDDHYVEEQLNPGSDLNVVMQRAQQWQAEPFPTDRPLWKLGLFTGLEDGKAAVVIKVHHAIADGMGMVLMLGAFTDLERNPATRSTPSAPHNRHISPPRRAAFSPLQRFGFKVMHAAKRFSRAPFGTVETTKRALGSAYRLVTPHRKPLSPLMKKRSGDVTMDTRTVPLETFRTASATTGTSLNDTFVAIVSDALVRYHDEFDKPCHALRMHMPIDARNERTAVLAGNQFVPARVVLDLSSPVASDRANKIASQLGELRAEPALHHVNSVSSAVQRLGKPAARFIIGGMMKGVDVLASNVPGPPFPLYLAGTKIEQFYAFGPPTGASLNVTLFSYNDEVWIGITTDTGAVTDHAAFMRCLDDALVAGLPTVLNSAVA